MSPRTDPRPGIAYRRPDGDPNRLQVESNGDSDLPVDELPRTEWLETVHPSDRAQLREELDTTEVDITYRIRTGSDPTWVQEHGRRADDGDVVGYLFPASDRVRRQQQLERQRERLDEFASVVSHDLRNPMSVAVGNLELAREFEGEAADERVERAMDALDRMDELISDLLSLAREGRTVESTAEADLRSVVDRAWSTIGGTASAELVVDDELPSIDCDRSRLRQALENLFRNAVEHGTESDPDAVAPAGEAAGPTDGVPPGTFDDAADDDGTDGDVRVRVGRTPDGFYVADDGPGIAPEQREAVFEPGHTTADDGTGFGLAIVERVAEAHGWSVSIAESRAGGARFEFVDVDVFEGSGATDDPVADDSGRSSAE